MLFIYSALAHKECWDSLVTTVTGLHRAWSRNRDSFPSRAWDFCGQMHRLSVLHSYSLLLQQSYIFWSTTVSVSGCQKQTAEKDKHANKAYTSLLWDLKNNERVVNMLPYCVSGCYWCKIIYFKNNMYKIFYIKYFINVKIFFFLQKCVSWLWGVTDHIPHVTSWGSQGQLYLS